MKMESVDNRVSNGQMLELCFFFNDGNYKEALRCGKFNSAQGKTLGHITHFSFCF